MTMADEQLLTPIEGIRRHLRRGVRTYITGSPEASLTLAAPEDRWHGADAATTIVHANWSMLIGGLESLFLQTLHPPTMAGVADHSAYETDPLGRLHRTARFLALTSFGTQEQEEAAIDRVRRIHQRVNGLTPDGVPYSAMDSHSLLWVHVTEVDGFLRAFQRYGSVDLSETQADQYVAEMAKVGERLGIDEAPRTVAELGDVIDSYRPELTTSAQSRRAIRFLLVPPLAPPALAGYAVVLPAALELLPSWARRKLRLPPQLPLADRLIVGPAARGLLAGLGWIMDEDELD